MISSVSATCFLAVAVVWCGNFSGGVNLSCHCATSADCLVNGYCPNGCENGWYGPGCQIGNVALRKHATQSTTYTGDNIDNTASKAVDGAVQWGISADHCSHTAVAAEEAWWYVELDNQIDFVIQNVTIVNRNNSIVVHRLSNFTIVYTTSVTNNPPDFHSWTICTHVGAPQQNLLENYVCSTEAVAKRVGIRLLNNSTQNKNILTLCEVIVNGYQKHDCPPGFFGPGCLLRNCTVSPCDSVCNDANGCFYSLCPKSSVVLPTCWIEIPSTRGLTITSLVFCNNITIRFYGHVKVSRFGTSSLIMELKFESSNSTHHSDIPQNGLVNISITVPALEKNRTFMYRIVMRWCNESHGVCYFGHRSNWTKIIPLDHPEIPSTRYLNLTSFLSCNSITISVNGHVKSSQCGSYFLDLELKSEDNISTLQSEISDKELVNISFTLSTLERKELKFRISIRWCSESNVCHFGPFTNWSTVFLPHYSKSFCSGNSVLKVTLPCRCANDLQCNDNGFCPHGCANGWVGPGCQVGNFALHKTANQSSTYDDDKDENDKTIDYSASMAVDGRAQSNSEKGAVYCTHTKPATTGHAWWYVELDRFNDVVIEQVTITSRRLPYGNRDYYERLRNFSVVYTSMIESGPPDSTWTTCVNNSGQQSIISSRYSCHSAAFGKKLGVLLRNSYPNNILTLCEVMLQGYHKIKCNEGFTGPGCLLRDCERTKCRDGCRDYGGCNYTNCPDSDFLPPHCWIRLPSLRRLTSFASPTCNNIHLNLDRRMIDGDLNITHVTIEIESESQNETHRESITITDGPITKNVFAMAGRTYSLRMTPQWCNQSFGVCFPGPSSNWTGVATASRNVTLEKNDSCLHVRVTSTINNCEQLTFLINCKDHFNVSLLYGSNGSALCELPKGAYRCSVFGYLNGNIVYQKALDLEIGDMLSRHSPNISCHCARGTRCRDNYYCPDGCDTGWYGPGCQVGNIALYKSAKQSSTHIDEIYDSCALMAVDGIVPSDGTYNFCSRTQMPSSEGAWWYVQLSHQEEFVIQSVEIQNVSDFEHHPRNFSVMFTSSSKDGPPDDTWTTCSISESSKTGHLVHHCPQGSYGDKVGVTLHNQIRTELTLCEVIVNGYQKRNCTYGYTGPGCLLRDCKVGNCNEGCDDFGGCKYSSCPDSAFLPPDCWIRLPSLKTEALRPTTTCNLITVNISSHSIKGDLKFSSVILEMKSDGHNKFVNETLNITDYYVGKSVFAQSGTTYSLRLLPQWCHPSSRVCFYGPGTNWTNVKTEERSHSYLINATCFIFNISDPFSICEELTWQIECFDQENQEPLSSTNETVVCGHKAGRNYKCEVLGYADDNLVDKRVYSISGLSEVPSQPNVSSTVLLIVGLVATVLLGAVFVTIFFLILRRKQTDTQANKFVKHEDDMKTEEFHLEPSPYYNAEEEQTYGNMGGLSLVEFEEYVKNTSVITGHFVELRANDMHPCTIGKKPEYKSKNRFQNILPYDRNRVVITGRASSYINASYIDGYTFPRQYIATQGPTAATLDDFWNMIWQEKSSNIVMLTNYIEKAKKKCERYFPRSSTRACPVDVEVKSTITFDSHVITVLEVRCGDETRAVNHLHFVAWPDHSVPKHCADILLFRSKLDPSTNVVCQQRDPVVVHCSAGVGRTGAFIAFNNLLQQFKAQARIDVDSCVQRLREQRMLMIQTKEQYVFLHRVTLYAIKTLKYIFDPAVLPVYGIGVNQSSHPESSLMFEWQALKESADPSSESKYRYFHSHNYDNVNVGGQQQTNEACAGDLQVTNSNDAMQTESDMSFVYCNGCYSGMAYLVAALPKQMKESFLLWSVAFEVQASCVVMLLDEKDFEPPFPSAGNAAVYDYLHVTNLGRGGCIADKGFLGRYALTIERIKKLPGTQSLPVTLPLFVIDASSWSSPEDESQLERIVSLGNDLTAISKERRMQPMIVLCRDGRSHSGVFISLLNSLQRLMENRCVQVFHSSDLVRASSSQFISSEVQYQFIYRVLRRYHENSTIYSNC